MPSTRDPSALRGWSWEREYVPLGNGSEQRYPRGFSADMMSKSSFRVEPDSEAIQVASDLEFPNGMVVTPDNATLIISESFAGRLTAFDIDDDGRLFSCRAWAESLGPDATCLDADGAIWVQTADTRGSHRCM